MYNVPLLQGNCYWLCHWVQVSLLKRQAGCYKGAPEAPQKLTVLRVIEAEAGVEMTLAAWGLN